MSSNFVDSSIMSLQEATAGLLPDLLVAGVLFLGGWVLAFLASWVAGRLLGRFALDRRLEGTDLQRGLEAAGLKQPLSHVLRRLVFWLVVLSAGIVALATAGVDLSHLPIRSLLGLLPALVAAILILVAGSLLAAFLGRATTGALAGLGADRPEVLGRLVRWLVFAVTVIVTLDQLGFDVGVVSSTFAELVAIALAGVALAFALGGREISRSLLAAHYIRQLYVEGDEIEVEGRRGILRRIGPVSSLLAIDGALLVMPNHLLLHSPVLLRTEPEGSESSE